MKYLIKIDGLFYGYDNIFLLSIDRTNAKKEGREVGQILWRINDPLKTIYEPITDEVFEGRLETARIIEEDHKIEWEYEMKKAQGLIPTCPGDI